MTMTKKTDAPAAAGPDKTVQKKSYTVIEPLSHDQSDYAIGETVELTDAEAKPLLGRAVEETKTETT